MRLFRDSNRKGRKDRLLNGKGWPLPWLLWQSLPVLTNPFVSFVTRINNPSGQCAVFSDVTSRWIEPRLQGLQIAQDERNTIGAPGFFFLSLSVSLLRIALGIQMGDEYVTRHNKMFSFFFFFIGAMVVRNFCFFPKSSAEYIGLNVNDA